jgi:hypothetical protein
MFSDFPQSKVKNARLKKQAAATNSRTESKARLRVFFPQAAKAKLTGQVRWPPEIN